MQLVAQVPLDESEPDTRWLSVSGGEGFGFLIRRHTDQDSKAPYDDWAHSLEEAVHFGDAYGVSRSDWRKPDRPWVNAQPPVGFKGD
jgi:hypothetical protein